MIGLRLEFARFCVLLMPLLVGGCSFFDYSYDLLFATLVPTSKISISVVDRANDNSPIAFDLVFISTRAPLEETLSKLSATDWFAQREQMLRDYKDDMAVLHWEVVPGQIIATQPIARPPSRLRHGAFLYAAYKTPGAHRYRVTDEDPLVIIGDLRDFTVSKK
jgi:type VI secretion system protein